MKERDDYKAWFYKPVQPERYDILEQYTQNIELLGLPEKYGGRADK
jgi:hypothetical protein